MGTSVKVKCLIIFNWCLQLSLALRSEILYNLADLYKNNLTINENCKVDLKHVIDGIQNNDMWAMKLLDASGRRESGFVWGNNYWLGSKLACDTINTPVSLFLSSVYDRMNFKNLTEGDSTVPVEYRMVYARHYPKLQVDVHIMDRKMLHMGFCFPQSCNNEDTMVLTSEMFLNSNFSELNFLSRNTTAVLTKTLTLRDNFYNDTFFKIMISVFIVNIVCLIVGSIYVGYLNFRRIQKMKVNENNRNNNNNQGEKGANAKDCVNKESKNEERLKPTMPERFFKCFSIVENAKLIASHNLGRESISVIHGLRAIGMVYIILGHIFVYTVSGNDNFEAIFLYLKIWIFQPLAAVALAVDTYFLIRFFAWLYLYLNIYYSALLLSYMFFQRLKTERKTNSFVATAKGVVNRYLRLTPSYFVVIIIRTVSAKFLRDTSQFWSWERDDVNCSKYWWRNLLYINNFFPMGDMCMSWSWFLSVDFQCFVLASILLNLYRNFRKTSIAIFGIIFVAATLFNGYLGYQYSYALSIDSQFNTIDYLYTPLSARVCAYIVGILTGWFLSECKSNKNISLSKTQIYTFWTVGPLLNIFLIFCHLCKQTPMYMSVLYPAFGKTLWAIGISWVIIACTLGHGGIIGKILNAKSLIPFSRMTYSVYLLNPLIIIFIVMSTDTAFHLDFASLIMQSVGILALSFLIGYIFMLIFENPYIMLIRTYVERTIK